MVTTRSLAIQKEVDGMTTKYDAIIIGTGQSGPSLSSPAISVWPG